MRFKKLLPLSLTIFGFAFGQEVKITYSQVQIIDTKALSDALISSSNSFIDELLSGLGLPPVLKEPIDSIVKSLYKEFLCKVKTPSFSLEKKLPASVSIPLSCSQVSISFSPFYKEILENADSLSGGVVDLARKCFKGDLKACEELAKKNNTSPEEVKKGIVKNDVMFAKGIGQENLADKGREQIEQEYQNRVNTLSKPSVDSTNPKGAVLNNVVGDARFSAESEASTSTGELLSWGKEYSKNFPPQVKPYYNYIANKQLMRKTVIEALRQRIKEERANLVRLASEVRAWCNKEWNINTIPPVRGGIVFGNPQTLYALTRGGKLPIVFTSENSTFPLTRGCPCCSCECVEIAKNSVKAKIESAKREVENTIERVGNMLADVISAEEYRTRQQINAVGQGITDALKQTMCFRARLELQRNQLQLLQLEVAVAQLQVLYSQMNKEEMKEYKTKLKELRLNY